MEEGSVPSSVDRSRVLDVKPLRSLTPVFPSPPFVSSPPFGPYPNGYSPFFPFSFTQESDTSPDQNPPTQSPPPSVFSPTPIQSYRNPKSRASNGDMGSTEVRKRARSSKKTDTGTKMSVHDFLHECSSFQQDDGNRETVNYVLGKFDALRRWLGQADDAKKVSTGIIKRPDLKAGNILLTNGLRTNMRKRIGVVPGVEIGDIFFFRLEMCVVGLHSQSMGGIDYLILKGTQDEPVAVSIVSSGGYDDDVDDNDVLIYSGQGGNINNKDKQAADQKLERGNLALSRSLHQTNPVRVVRGTKDTVNPLTRVYFYDGLYTISEAWVEKGKSDCNIFKYKLVRIPGQPSAFAVWKSIEKWKEGISSRPGFILQDLSSGAESIPVSLVNEVDEERPPAYFTYIPTLRYTHSFKLLQPNFGCSCRNACLPGDLNCSCIRKNGGDFPYTANGILVCRKPLIHECGPTCPCFSKCKNRVSQTGLKVRMEVFKTANKGWGLRSWDPIRAGTFICEYAGEVIETSKGDDEYVFDTKWNYDDSFKWNYDPRLVDEETPADTTEDHKFPSRVVISAKTVGNVARFMNHSCSPNVFWQLVLYEHNNESFLHVAFFAIKHIPPLTELTFDYGSETHGKKTCLCGSLKCRGFFG